MLRISKQALPGRVIAAKVDGCHPFDVAFQSPCPAALYACEQFAQITASVAVRSSAVAFLKDADG